MAIKMERGRERKYKSDLYLVVVTMFIIICLVKLTRLATTEYASAFVYGSQKIWLGRERSTMKKFLSHPV